MSSRNYFGTVVLFLLLSGFVDNVISDLLWAKSIVLTSPTVATVGLSITIPLAMVSDFLIFSDVPSAKSFSGASLVILGFFLVIWQSKDAPDTTELFSQLDIDEQKKELLSLGDDSINQIFVESKNDRAISEDQSKEVL